MSSPTQDRAATFGIVAVGAAAGALAAYYLASRPAVRYVVWQVLKTSLTTTLPAIVLAELQSARDDERAAMEPGSVLQD